MTQETEAMTVGAAAEALSDESFDGLLGLDEIDTPDEQEEEASDEVEADEVDAEGGEAPSEDSEDEETDNEEEAEIQSLADMAEALGVDVDELEATINTKIKVDGEESDVTLAELRRGYQREKDYTQKTMAVAEKDKQLTVQHEQAIEQVQQQSQVAGAVLREVQKLFAGEHEQILSLMETDPNAGVVAKARYDQRMQQFHQIQQAASAHYDQFSQENKTRSDSSRAELENTEREKLASAIPDWDQEKANELSNYLVSQQGFSPDFISSTLDHKFFVMANKAMQFDTKVETAKLAEKRVKKLPKVQKPAKKISAPKSNYQKAAARLKRSGDINDAANAIANSPSLNKVLGF